MVAAGSAIAQNIPNVKINHRRPLTSPLSSACRQLTAAPGGAPGWFAWGPTIEGVHQNWKGVEANVPPEQAYERLAAMGLCVQAGELVPFSPLEASKARSPMERNLEELRNKGQGADPASLANDGFSAFMLLMLVMFGGVHLWEKFEERPWVKRIAGNQPSAPFDHLPPSFNETTIPDRVSPEDLGDLPNSPDSPRSAQTPSSTRPSSPAPSSDFSARAKPI